MTKVMAAASLHDTVARPGHNMVNLCMPTLWAFRFYIHQVIKADFGI